MILLGVIQAFSHSFKVPELGANFSAKEISTREPLNKNSPNLLDFESSRRGEKKRAPLLCRGQAGLQHGRSLRVCPANPHGLMLGNRRLLQKYQPVKRNTCTSSAYKNLTVPHKTTKGSSWLLRGVTEHHKYKFSTLTSICEQPLARANAAQCVPEVSPQRKPTCDALV